MNKTLLTAIAVALGATAAAQAQAWSVSGSFVAGNAVVSLGYATAPRIAVCAPVPPPVVCYPAPVVYLPAPVVYVAGPVAYAWPPPVYRVAPAPICGPRVAYYGRIPSRGGPWGGHR